MNETELERLVVRLTGDMSSYVDALKQAQQSTKEAADKVQADAKKMENSLTNVAAAAATAWGAAGVKQFIQSTLHEWEQSEMAVIQLEAAIRANGGAVEEASLAYQEWSSVMQETTTMSDEQALSLVKQAETFQLTGSQARKAATDAAAVAKANGSSAEAMLRFTAAMAKGDMERAMMFTRMIPQLRGVKDETELLARYEMLVASGMETMTKEAETFGGQTKILANQWSDLKEGIGRATSEALLPAVSSMIDIVKWMNALPSGMKSAATWTLGLGAALTTVATVGPKVVTVLTAIIASTKALTVAMLTNPFAWAAVAAVLLAAIIAKVFGLTSALQEMNKELERSKELTDELFKLQQKSADKMISGIDKMADDSTKYELIQNRLKNLNRDLADARKYLAAAEDVRGETFPSIERYQEAGRNIEFYKQRITMLRDAIERLKEIENRSSGISAGEFKLRFIMMGVTTAFQTATAAIEDFKNASKDYDAKLTSDAEALYERLKTPLEKIEDQRIRLDEMLLSGKIGENTYQRALEDLEKQLRATAEAQAALNREFDAAMAGTDEAAKRGAEFLRNAYGGHSGAGREVVNIAQVVGRLNDPPQIPRGMARGPGQGDVDWPAANKPAGFVPSTDKTNELLAAILGELRGGGSVGIVRVGAN